MVLPNLVNEDDPPAAIAGAGTRILEALALGCREDADLLRLFDGNPHPQAAFDDVVGADGRAGLVRYGCVAASDAGTLRAVFALRLINGLLLVTDLPAPPGDVPENYVDPLWESPTLSRLIVNEPGGTALDMGCGCGIFALTLSRTSRAVWGADINPRALALSNFNAALNAITNVQFVYSDLFNAFPGQRFDYVVFSSPTGEEFAPVNLLQTGETILERFFKDLPTRLTPAGKAQVTMCGKDWQGDPFFARMDRWLGPDANRFQAAWLEIWRCDRGRAFVMKRLTASLKHRINAFRCSGFLKGWLTLSQGTGPSLQISTDYHGWPADLPSEARPNLIRAMLTDPGKSQPALPPTLASLLARARPLLRSARPA